MPTPPAFRHGDDDGRSVVRAVTIRSPASAPKTGTTVCRTHLRATNPVVGRLYDEDIRDRTPLGPCGTLEEMATCATFLAQTGHFVTGEALRADGAWTPNAWHSRET